MRIVHITDTHIVPEGQSWLNHSETQTAERLASVVGMINQLTPLPDIVIHTGDLTDKGDPESTRHAKLLMDELSSPYMLITGNHDDREEIRMIFADRDWMPKNNYIQYVQSFDDAHIIALDTLRLGRSSGELCSLRMQWLEDTLQSLDTRPIFLLMHQPPILTGVKPLDDLNCEVPERFWELMRQYPHILYIFCGHYHHPAISQRQNGPSVFLAPSVAPRHSYTEPNRPATTGNIQLSPPHFTIHDYSRESGVLNSHVRDVSRFDEMRYR